MKNTAWGNLLRPLFKLFIALLATIFVLWLIHEDVELNHGIVENGYVETAQIVFCALSAVFAGLAARRSREFGRVLVLLALTFLAMFFRELDDVLDKLIFHGAWKLFALPLGGVFALLAFRRFRETVESAEALLETPAGRHMEIGFIILLGFSRVMGSKLIWNHLISQNAFQDIQVLKDIPITPEAFGYLSRAAKNAVEEGLELFAYMLIFLALAEILWTGFRTAREESRKPNRLP